MSQRSSPEILPSNVPGRRIGLLLLVLAVLSNVSACQAQPRVKILTKGSGEVAFLVEVADTAGKRQMGLQYRQALADDRGMIFLFPTESLQTFWMKNTPISLDMIFINRDRKIVGIVERTVPFSLDARSVSKPSQYVLEINGGLARRYGIQTGDSVRFEGIKIENVKE
jgi:uncharacterized membrane protein (UPF0127 family)